MASDFPKFTFADFICWKILPSIAGCGKDYIWSFKYAWITYNKLHIKNEAVHNNIPTLLLAGVALIEVGGEDFTDWPIFLVRSFDWIGTGWVDRHLTITKNPALTSMGAVNIQLRRAAETMGLNPSTLTHGQLSSLADALQSDVTNLNIVAKHLKKLILVDYPDVNKTSHLTDEQIRIFGTRYWYGPDKDYDSLKHEGIISSSYGSRIIVSARGKVDVKAGIIALN